MIYNKLFADVHLRSGLFYRLTKWNVEEISHQKNSNGFIVQHIIRTDKIYEPSLYEKKLDYWEAWVVVDGIVYTTSLQLDRQTKRNIYSDAPPSQDDDFDDEWSNDIDGSIMINSSKDLRIVLSEENIKKSHEKRTGQKGQIVMHSDVFWVERGTAAFEKVVEWENKLPQVGSAGALRASYNAEFLLNEKKIGSQEPLIHEYDLFTEEARAFALKTDLLEYTYILNNKT